MIGFTLPFLIIVLTSIGGYGFFRFPRGSGRMVVKVAPVKWFRFGLGYNNPVLFATDDDNEEDQLEFAEPEVEDDEGDEEEAEDDDFKEEEIEEDSIAIDSLVSTDVDIDQDTNDDSSPSPQGELMTWKQRIASASFNNTRAARRSKLEDDPLCSSSPTRDLIEPVDRFTKFYLALSDVDVNMLQERSKVWIHHMQWARRSALLPHSSVKVDWEYTRLSEDCTAPVGQVISFRANTSESVFEYLESEPLQAVRAINPWKVYEISPESHDNTTWEMKTMKLFIGFDRPLKKSDKLSVEDRVRLRYNQLDHHQAADHRIAYYAHILPINDSRPILSDEDLKLESLFGTPSFDPAKVAIGTIMVINARTNIDTKRYMDTDPVVKANLYQNTLLSPVNLQDIDGKHHLMARTFAQKTILDQIHFEDPEDLLLKEVEEVEGLPLHSSANKEALEILAQNNVSYRYTRLSLQERYGRPETPLNARLWDYQMEKEQAIRLEPVLDELPANDPLALFGAQSGDFGEFEGSDDETADEESSQTEFPE